MWTEDRGGEKGQDISSEAAGIKRLVHAIEEGRLRTSSIHQELAKAQEVVARLQSEAEVARHELEALQQELVTGVQVYLGIN